MTDTPGRLGDLPADLAAFVCVLAFDDLSRGTCLFRDDMDTSSFDCGGDVEDARFLGLWPVPTRFAERDARVPLACGGHQERADGARSWQYGRKEKA